MKKGEFAGLIFLGIISAIFGILGPLHEVWHWLAAFLSGVPATIGWGRTYIDTKQVTLFIGFAGLYGEVTIHMLLMLKLTSKKHYLLATYILGYTSSFVLAIISFFVLGFTPIDIKVMYGNYNNTLVDIIFYVWMLYYACLLFIQIALVVYGKTEFFPHLYVKEVQKTLKRIHKSEEIRQNRYKPLTLVK